MDLMKALDLKDLGTTERKANEKRRRLSYLKAKHQNQFQPSEARVPKPKAPRPSTTQTLLKGAKKISTAAQAQAKKIPSDKALENFVWRSGEQKKG